MAVYSDLEGHWSQSIMRFAQINTGEIDPTAYDVADWEEFLKDTHAQAVVLNAAGIVAFYPSEIKLQTRTPYLGDRDMFGEQVASAKKLGIKVFARLDVGQADRRFYYSHPDWFAVGPDGKPLNRRVLTQIPARELYTTCPNGPYYWEYAPQLMREIISKYDVDALFDNGWPAWRRNEGICHCKSCKTKFKAFSGMDLPADENWKSPVWRRWIEWRYTVMEATWKLFNDVCRAAKPSSFWLGNIPGDEVGVSMNNTEWLALSDMSPIIEADHQGRSGSPLWDNGAHGKLMRASTGGKPTYNVNATWYYHMPYWWRLGAKPEAEQRIWMCDSVAAGTRPWWTVIGGLQEDRRSRKVTADLFAWHAKQDKYFSRQTSLANVAIYYSPRSYDYYGQQDPKARCQDPYRGMYDALLQARIPFDVVHEGRLSAQELAQYKLLALPNIACMSDKQLDQIRAFVKRGGSLLATFETSLYDENGDHRDDYGLKDLLGVTYTGAPISSLVHSYMTLDHQHPALGNIFEGTPWIGNGGSLALCQAASDSDQPLVLTPTFPVYPPEHAYTTLPRVDVSLLYLRELGASRIAYLPGDLDRFYFNSNNPDLAELIGNLAKWCLNGEHSATVTGEGTVDFYVYQGAGNVQVHLVNLTNPDYWRGPCKRLNTINAQEVAMKLPAGFVPKSGKLLRAEKPVEFTVHDGVATATVPSILDYEVLVLE